MGTVWSFFKGTKNQKLFTQKVPPRGSLCSCRSSQKNERPALVLPCLVQSSTCGSTSLFSQYILAGNPRPCQASPPAFSSHPWSSRCPEALVCACSIGCLGSAVSAVSQTRGKNQSPHCALPPSLKGSVSFLQEYLKKDINFRSLELEKKICSFKKKVCAMLLSMKQRNNVKKGKERKPHIKEKNIAFLWQNHSLRH